MSRRRNRKGAQSQASQPRGWSQRLQPWLGKLGSLAVVTLMALGVAGLLHWLQDPATLPLRQVQIEGRLQYLTEEEVREAIVDVARGGFFSADVAAVQAALESLSWVDQVSVRRLWPDTLRLRVREQVPVARWGEERLLNPRGESFPAEGRTLVDALPRLEGPPGREAAVLTQYLALREHLAGVGLGISRMVQDPRRAVTVVLDNGVVVALGRSDPRRRLERFVRAYPGVFAARTEELVKVDLRYSNGFAVEWSGPAQVEKG